MLAMRFDRFGGSDAICASDVDNPLLWKRWMVRVVLATGFALNGLIGSNAQTAGSVAPVATPGLSVPTTKVLALGTFTSMATANIWRPMVPAEARAAMGLYLEGKIDQWYVKQDGSGIVMILNVTDTAEARRLLDRLPAVHNGLMTIDVIALGPLSPLRSLIAERAK